MSNATTIMIVEDNPHTRQALTAILSLQDDIQIMMEASNGLEAINTIREKIPDLVLMDMRMPIMDGLEATRIIKQNWPQIKIVVLTMYSEYQSEVLFAGADAFLIKGCSTEAMMSSIHDLIHAG